MFNLTKMLNGMNINFKSQFLSLSEQNNKALLTEILNGMNMNYVGRIITSVRIKEKCSHP